MKNLVILFIAVVFVAIPNVGEAFTTFDTYFGSDHEAPAWFLQDGQGGFYGETTGGVLFTQKAISNDVGIRLQKFTVGEVYFYISNKGVIYAGDDLEALSIYFMLV